MRAAVENALHWLDQHPPLATSLGVIAILLLAGLVLAVARRLVLPIFAELTRRSTGNWDDVLFQQKFFHRVTWALPWLTIHQLAPLVPHLAEGAVTFLRRLSICALVIVCVRALGALASTINEIYVRYPTARFRPIKGYLQGMVIAAWVVGVVVIIATLLNRSPLLILSGLGALTAVLLLVFRDTLLSFVAGIQLTTNDLVRVGDWIEMPQFAADGDVVDISLHAVKVQNWDKTITVIPTHRFLEHSFKNWRGMQESGGRRIKRAFHVDMTSIRFIPPEEIERFGRFSLLQDYIAQKKQELELYNYEHEEADPNVFAHSRRLTNVGTLRAWIMAFLRQHPMLHQDRTLLVRQLAPTAEGLPIEIYVFCNDTAWTTYETVQADIFDHVLSIVPEFGLRVFQNPSSYDFASLAQARAGGASQAASTPGHNAVVVDAEKGPQFPFSGPEQ